MWSTHLLNSIFSLVIFLRRGELSLQNPLSQDAPREIEEILESPRITNRGVWGNWEYCPEGSFVTGMNLKIEGEHKGDNTGLNAIQLLCEKAILDSNPKDKKRSQTNITSTQGLWGYWRGQTNCHGIATGFQTRSGGDEGCDKNMDVVSATDLKLFCATSKDNPKEIIGGAVYDYGLWRSERKCIKGSGICGLRTQVEPDKGNLSKLKVAFSTRRMICDYDDTALNNVDMACCKIPSPVETCEPNVANLWVDIIGCGEGLACKRSVKKGITFSTTNSKTTQAAIETLEELGIDLQAGVNGVLAEKFSAKLGNKNSEGQLLSDILSQISTEEETIDIDMAKCQGRMQEMVLKCGIVQARTAFFRCFNQSVVSIMDGHFKMTDGVII